MAFGGSVSQLASNLIAEQQGDSARAQQALQMLMQEQARRRAESQQQGQFNTSLNLRKEENATQNARQTTLDALRKEESDRNYELSKGYLAVAERNADTKQEGFDKRNIFNLALGAVETGDFNPDDPAWSTLTAPERVALAKANEGNRQDIAQGYARLESLALAKNRLAEIDTAKKILEATKPTLPSYAGIGGKARRLIAGTVTDPNEDWNQEEVGDWMKEFDSDRAKQSDYLTSNASIKGENPFANGSIILAPDGVYRPAMKKPAWLTNAPPGGGFARVAPAQTATVTQPSPAQIPPAPAPEQRQPNAVYQTPRGPLRWTGTGWTTP